MRTFYLLLLFFIKISGVAQFNKDFESIYYPHQIQGKWGFVNKYGIIKIDPVFEEAFPFIEGLALVKKDGKYGYINRNSEPIINYDYDNAKSFIHNFAWVRKNDLEALIRKDGSLFLSYWFTQIEQFRNGYARVMFKNDSISKLLEEPFIVAYVNEEGKQLAGNWFSGGGNFTDGRAKVSISGEYFYLDTMGKIEFRSCDECDEATPFEPEFKPDEMPIFPGGESGLNRFIDKNLKYPDKAEINGIQGKVYVKFAVSSKGEVLHISIDKGVHYLLDEAAMKLVSMLPYWKPAIKNGEQVCVWIILPIIFQILQ